MFEPSEIQHAEPSHEEVFLARYGSLRTWAHSLTGGDAARAEDLVHDAYVHFTLARPDLALMRNLDGYLYQMLRNLNTSQLRRAARRREDAPAVVEYDSIEFALRAADPRDLIRVQDDLRQVCHYACLRKESSKAGSVLILRFMHGYYPGEIARFTRTTREAVEERLRVARSEAKQYLKDPESLRFINTQKSRAAGRERAAATGYAETHEELLRDLRGRVFDSRRGECPDEARLSELYEGSAAGAPDCATLAHLVSCPVCIDEVNRLRGLAPLAERFPTDALGNEPRRGGRDGGGGDDDGGDGGDEGGSGTAGRASGDEAGRCRRRAREVFEHRPRELCVSVNGRVLAAQKVGSAVSEQKLNVGGGEAVDFVEVFSEQSVRLLYLDPALWPADVDGGRTVSVGLSDRRVLEARLTYVDSAPTVQVVYHDPLLAEAPLEVEAESVDDRHARESGREHARIPRAGVAAAAWRWLRRLLGHLASPFTTFRPGAVAAALALFVVAALLFTRFNTTPVSAAELLRRAAEAEETAVGGDFVLHRTVYVEEARADGRGRVSRTRVETWQGGASRIRLRRLYDEQGRLVAGEWTKSDGTVAVYRRNRPPSEAGAADSAGALALLEAGDAWRVEPSAVTFKTLGAGDELKVEDKLGAYIVGREAASVDEGLQSASLWLNKSDLRAFRMSLVVRRGGETFEYRFIESGFERRRAGEVPPTVYRLEPELLGSSKEAKDAKTDGGVAGSQDADEARPPSGVNNTQAIASAELEVEVAYLLNRIKANLGEQVSMGRTTGGALRVEALVESEGRKEAILRALGPVLSNPAVSVEVSTVAEELARRERAEGRATTEREVVVGAGRIPADAELRAHFGARLADGARVDAEIKRFAASAMSHSRQALMHASALRRLAGRFTPDEARALQPDARAKWLSMVREHAGAYRREVAALRAQLTPVFGSQGGGGGGAPLEGSLAQAAERLLQLSYAQDDAVRTAFTISESGGSAAAIKSAQFWRALAASERLAASVQEAYER